MPSLNVWIMAARPKTLPAAIAPVIIGTAMAYGDGGWHLSAALAALLGAVFIQIGTNLANDYADFKKGTDTEERLGPTRVTQAGLASPSAVRNAAGFVFALALLMGLYLVMRGGWPIVIIGILSILFGVLYTSGPAPLAYIGIADLFVLIFFGPVAVAGTYYVQTLAFSPVAVIAGLSPGLFSVAILTVNNLRDINSDHAANKRTLAVRFGATYARTQYLLSILIACAIPVWLYVDYRIPVFSMSAGAVVLLASPLIRIVYTQEGRVLNAVLAGTGRVMLVFAILYSVGWLL